MPVRSDVLRPVRRDRSELVGAIEPPLEWRPIEYWIKTEPMNDKPMNLLRVDGRHTVDVWFQGEWQRTATHPLALDGIGGSADYFRISPEDEGELVPRFKVSLSYDDFDFDESMSESFAEARERVAKAKAERPASP